MHLDASVKVGLSKLEYTARQTNSLDIWLLHVKEGAILILTLAKSNNTSARSKIFRRVGVVFVYTANKRS